LTNVTISGNSAYYSGGGILIYNYDSYTFNNSIIWGNSAPLAGNEFYIRERNSSVILNYSCYKNNSGDITNY